MTFRKTSPEIQDMLKLCDDFSGNILRKLFRELLWEVAGKLNP